MSQNQTRQSLILIQKMVKTPPHKALSLFNSSILQGRLLIDSLSSISAASLSAVIGGQQAIGGGGGQQLRLWQWSKPDKFKVRCGTDQRPLKTTNLRFVAEQIHDHLRWQETYSDVAESEQRKCRTTDIRVDGVDDGHIAKTKDSTAYR
ncbi:hypothetical protein Scep_003774 [Stephania cephalantha]|uniref:Uncharacterized protein n=1 Tax=Stephania cephalantha TaxID=152367 RepID=A0AAP0KTQ1_9MAGN